MTKHRSINVSEHAISEQTDREKSIDTGSTPHSYSPWQPGVWERFPFLAFLALAFTTIATVVMIIVLTYSNGRPADWRVAPSVLLALAAALANLSLRYALGEGVIISWWTKTLKPGTKLEDLHNTWAFGNYLKDAILSGTAFNFVALAGIAVSLAPINGVLLQRASSITSMVNTQPFVFNIPLAQEFPEFYTGSITTRGSAIDVLTTNFSAIVNQYNRKIPFNLTESSCTGRCSGVIQAAGYAITCKPYNVPFDITQAAHPVYGNIDGPAFFSANFTFSDYSPTTSYLEVLNFTSVYKDGNSCAGTIHVANCTLVPATLKQHVILTNKTISLDPAYNYTSDSVVKFTPSRSSGSGSTHGGMALLLSTRYNSIVNTHFDGVYGMEVFSSGSSQLEYMVGGHDVETRGCNISWADPTADMLSTARELAFRVALRAADPKVATNMQPIVDGLQTHTVLVYTSRYLYLGLALMITLMGVLCVAPTFYGWWTLGRRVSMSPLEIAKAFDTRTLKDADSNAEVGSLLKEIGSRHVRYGVVDQTSLQKGDSTGMMGTTGGVLMISDPEIVTAPRKGMAFGG